MGLFSFISDIFGGNQKAKAAQKASAAQVAAEQQGINAITAQNALTTQNLEPWLTQGTSALGAQSSLLGLNGNDAQNASIQALQDSPLYKSLFRTGQDTVLGNAAATGGLRGGNIQSSLANFGSDTLAQVIQSQLQNLGGVSSQGLQTGLAEGQFGANSADTIAQLFQNQGTARAAGITGALAGNLQSLGGIGGALSNINGQINPPAAPPVGGSGGGGSTNSGGITSILSSLGKFLF